MPPAAGGNGLAMRAGVLLEALGGIGRVSVLVVPVFGGGSRPSSGDLPRLSRQATPETAARLAERARSVDLVVVMRLYLAPFLEAVLELPDRPRLVLDIDDLEPETWRALGRPEEATRFERLERRWLPSFDLVLTGSPADRDLLRARIQLPAVAVVPNAVRIPAPVDPGRSGNDLRHDLLMVGNLSYEPNVEAARWFCHEVMPQLPGRRAAVVGSNPEAAVTSLASPRLTVAASVPEVTTWYAGAKVAVVPVLRGGGTRIKLLEALAHARPVVSTTLGAAGAGSEVHGGAVLIADRAEEFATACRRLLEHPDEARALGLRGLRAVSASRTVDVVAPILQRAVRDILPA